ncbi:MAG TPA: hypothetical protein PKA37_04705, partial [Planctomycetota bacterium]|nr:hypothetical protein [Planctomycetota bacterium]
KVEVPAKRVVKFKVGRIMRDAVDGAPGEFALDHSEEEEEEVSPPPRAPLKKRPVPPVLPTRRPGQR